MPNPPQSIAIRVFFTSDGEVRVSIPARAFPNMIAAPGFSTLYFNLDMALQELGEAGWEQLPISIANAHDTLLFFKKV